MRCLVPLCAFLAAAALHSDQIEFEAAQKNEAAQMNVEKQIEAADDNTEGGGNSNTTAAALEESQSESSEEADEHHDAVPEIMKSVKIQPSWNQMHWSENAAQRVDPALSSPMPELHCAYRQ
ncbi:hypothetical protein EYF80_018405 [Liparis tanakae]|uniref:Uncharacterized protein n=1 Tax=Liparis tanakae TaxID=230148 RepID=A0A4Z2I040_9TELE|nr:hypothetical protein EYF80_018405 [Liparis tanakae]